MLVIPAVDIRGGKCVRLFKGRFEEETVFFHDPAEAAREWEARGAKLLHVVDLDGARRGRPENLGSIQAILRSVDIPIQLGGGIREVDTGKALLDLGVSRVVLGTAAARDLSFVKQAIRVLGKERVLVAIDAREGFVAVEGWQEATRKPAEAFARELREVGLEEAIFTDISRDGTLEGPSFQALEQLLATGLKIIASGGISSLEDISRLKGLERKGLVGAIVGKALYVGAFRLEEAMAIAMGDA